MQVEKAQLQKGQPPLPHAWGHEIATLVVVAPPWHVLSQTRTGRPPYCVHLYPGLTVEHCPRSVPSVHLLMLRVVVVPPPDVVVVPPVCLQNPVDGSHILLGQQYPGQFVESTQHDSPSMSMVM